MPAMITASASNAAVVIAQRIRALCFFNASKLFWQLRITHLIGVEIHDTETRSVFYFASPKVVQQRAPMFVFFQIFCDVL